MITSLSNKSVREVVLLNQKAKARNKQGLFVVEGPKMFAEAPEERITRVYIAQRAEKELREVYGEKLDRVFCEVVADPVFDKMSDTKTPQGILTLVKQYHYRLEELLAGRQKRICVSGSSGKRVGMAGGGQAKKSLFLVLEDIQDPGNLGTIFRTGEAVGVDGIFMSSRTVDVYNPKTIRSTMGSVYRVPFVYVENICETIHILQKNNICVYAAHLDGKEDYDACDYHKGTAFLIGNEGNGLREETAACAEKHIDNSDGRQRGISECGDGIDGAAVRGVPAEKKLTGAGKSPVQGAEIGKICNEENGRIKLFNHDLVKWIFGTATQKQGEKEKEDMHEKMHKRRILLFRVNSFKNRLQV